MQIYLPIAEISLNVFLLLGMGGLVGFLSGMFGVGGGFLMTPLLIFAGVPPAVAVASAANQTAAASISGAQAHLRRGGVDVKMGLVMIVGGAGGSYGGSLLFAWLKELGQVELTISLAYVIFLGGIGSLMVIESVVETWRRRNGVPRRPARRSRSWIDALPFKMRFRKSRQYISVLLPLTLGALVGVLAAIMGVGGGFIMVPAMIYLLNMPTNVVIGTSLFQITVVTACVTFLHSVNTQTVDVLLALMLLIGSVTGAQIGARVGGRLRGEHLRGLLGVFVLVVCGKLAYDLVIRPDELFSVLPLGN